MDNNQIERCNSAPILVWERLHQQEESGVVAKPQGLRLRRHSSLTRGLLHNVRKISESDERLGEAKINSEINLSSSTEKLNLSPAPPSSPGGLLASPSNMFRPIRNSPISDHSFSPYLPSPEKDLYGIRQRSGTGKQCTRPSSRKRSTRLSGESMPVDGGPTKRLRLESHADSKKDDCQARTMSSDSGISNCAFIQQNPSISRKTTSSDIDFWWKTTTTTTPPRNRRLSTESIVSVDSITKEINKPL